MKKITIQQPCPIKEGDMPSTEKGFYCTRCSREVVDFTEMEEDEIIQAVKRQNGRVCGKFRHLQLSLSKALLVGSLAGTLALSACNTKYNTGSIPDSPFTPPQWEIITDLDTLNGFATPNIAGVVELNNRESDDIAIGATVSIWNGKTEVAGTITEFDGSFQLELPEGEVGDDWVIRFSYTGYFRSEIPLKDAMNRQIKVRLDADETIHQTIIIGEVILLEDPEVG